jgi:bifunctional non-homologous end joining protein LigD
MTVRQSLKTYRTKRRFKRTPEPRGGRARHATASRFVVQRHAATSLHYDFRLEVGGVLKSWAVPKGLPARVGDKRLAMETEDHPLEYIDFEGTIPAGEYGAGTVVIWDRGTYRGLTRRDDKPVSADDALGHGQLELHLEGKKARGNYLLKRMGATGRKWLLIRVHAPPRVTSARSSSARR